MEKTVSIIVPAYNVEKYLGKCMESLCGQSYTNIEIILVDDGSSDSTPELCDVWGDKDDRIVVIHQKNGGQCAARNAALEAMSGDYVMYVDSDDYIRHDTVSQMVDFLEESDLDFVRSAYTRVGPNESAELENCVDTGEKLVFNQRGIIENFLLAPYSERKCFTAIMWAALYKASLFKSVRFPEGFIYEEGFVLPDVYLAANSAGYIDRSFYYYRENDDGTMARNKLSDKALKSLDDWREIHYKFKEPYPEFNKVTCERWVKGYLAQLAVLVENDRVDADGFYKNKIISTLTEKHDYFLQMDIDKSYIKEIETLISSIEDWKRFREKSKRMSLFSKFVAKFFSR